MKKSSKRWSNTEIEFLNENFEIKGAIYCAERLPNRTLESIRIKAARLGLKRDKEFRYRNIDAPKGYIYCPCCQQILPNSCFYKKTKKNSYGKKAHSTCRACSRENARRSYRQHKSSRQMNYKKNPNKKLYSTVKSRAKRLGLPFDIEIEDIQIPQTCPVLGIPLIPFSSSENSPTVDRFIPEKGYIKGNINVISRKANLIKTNASVEEIEKVLKWMKDEENKTK